MCFLCSKTGINFHALDGGSVQGASELPNIQASWVFANPSVSSVSSSGSQEIDGVLWGDKWQSYDVTYSFPSSSAELNYGLGSYSFQAFDSTQKQFARDCFEQFDNVCGLNLTEVNNSTPSQGTLQLFESTFAGSTARVIDFPGGGVLGSPTNDWNGDMVFNHTDFNSIKWGDWSGMTVLHEIGHSVGLSHGHQNSNGFGALNYSKDSHEYSLMTYKSFVGSNAAYVYNSSGSYSTTLMQSDIAALQYMYGANYNYNSGDTTYSWNSSTGMMSINGTSEIGAESANKIFMTLWDGGGTDTYDLSNYTTNLTIDLTPGSSSTFYTTQLAQLGGSSYSSEYASGNVYNALLYNNNSASLIENAIGGSGNDTITGNSAANTLTGGAGLDTLIGGEGNDAYYVDNTSDTVTENSGEGTDTVNSSVTWTLGSNVEILTLSGSSTINGTGNSLDNTITGNSAGNTLSGAAGTDTLNGGAGADSLMGNAGDDTLNGGAGSDTLNGGTGADTVTYATSSSGVRFTLIGEDAWNGDAEGDTFSFVENITGSAQADSLVGDNDANTLSGGAGADGLWGFDANDTLNGGAGADRLYGMNGADTLTGGAGDDALYGGSDGDTFVFASGCGDDTIHDFVAGSGSDDIIDLNAYTSSLGNLSAVLSACTTSGSNTVIDLGNGDSVTLVGVSSGNFIASDFDFA